MCTHQSTSQECCSPEASMLVVASGYGSEARNATENSSCLKATQQSVSAVLVRLCAWHSPPAPNWSACIMHRQRQAETATDKGKGHSSLSLILMCMYSIWTLKLVVYHNVQSNTRCGASIYPPPSPHVLHHHPMSSNSLYPKVIYRGQMRKRRKVGVKCM